MAEMDWHTLLSTNEISEGGVKEVFAEGNILVLAMVDDNYFVMDGICAHQGGPLGKGKLDGCRLTCPWHGWQYDIQSGKQLLSEVIAQKTYRTRVLNDTIQVQLTQQTRD